MLRQYRIGLFLVFAGMVSGVLAGVFYSLIHDLPQINQLKQFRPPSATTVFSSDQQVLTRFFIEKRVPVSIDKIPKNLINAILTVEDSDFYSHSGVNLKAIARAIVADLKAGKFKQGASTLTQQLAKTLFLTPEKSIVRKIREAILALQIERRYTKDEILELYLNQIYLGSGAYGVEAAAQTYFAKSVNDLTLGQAALVAGLPKAPSVYSPFNNPDRAVKRRQIVLKQMLAQKQITREAFEHAQAEKITKTSRTAQKNPAPYFIEYVKKNIGKSI